MTMDAHRKLMACIAVFVMLACMIPAVTDVDTTDAYGDANGILLYEVCSVDDKGVTLKNYSNSTIDLKGYYVSDKEGYFTFTKSLKLGAGQTITVALQDTDTKFTSRGTVYVIDKNDVGIVKTKSFDPAKNGDDIYLYNPSDVIVDAMCYGSQTITDSSVWTGGSVGKTNRFLQREGTFDTDSADDWFVYIEGLTSNPLEPDKFTATVTPFLFPDSGGIPIYQTLENAQESVYIEIYLLSNENIYALLIELEQRGVDVVLLHSGNPLGVGMSTIAPHMQALIDAGGEVKFILGAGSSIDRFSFVHCKYAIVDMETVILTSENWTAKNCNGSLDSDPYDKAENDGNRGWGAILESRDYAEYMKAVFDNDYSSEYGDTYYFNEKYPSVTASNPTYKAPMDASFESYTAPITPVLSNDNSYAGIEYVITNATERIYSQQQDLSSYYADLGETSPVMMMARQANANPEIDAKFILGEGKDSDGKAFAVEQVFLINTNTLVKAATMDKPYVHNKGVIGDDLVLIASVNWTPNSVENNREAGVIINSKEVSDYFANAFNKDFSKYYTYDGFKVDISEIKTTYPSGKEATVSVTVTPSSDTYTYLWDFGDGQTKETTVPRTTFMPTDGSHVLKVTVTNSSGNSQTTSGITYYVGSDIPTDPQGPTGPGSSTEEGEGLDIQTIIDEYGYYIIPIIVVILGLIGAALKHR